MSFCSFAYSKERQRRRGGWMLNSEANHSCLWETLPVRQIKSCEIALMDSSKIPSSSRLAFMLIWFCALHLSIIILYDVSSCLGDPEKLRTNWKKTILTFTANYTPRRDIVFSYNGSYSMYFFVILRDCVLPALRRKVSYFWQISWHNVPCLSVTE